MNHEVTNVDCILVFWSHDTRVAKRWAELYLEWYAPYILFSWWLWRLTKDWNETEADKFAVIAKKMGVPSENILIENKSTNSGENAIFSMKLLKDKRIPHETLLIVHKPYMERRAYATFLKHFPDQNLLVTSQRVSMLKYINDEILLESLINLLVWDLQRIIKYPEKWFQIIQDVPENVVIAMNQLIDYWYTKQII